MTRDIPEPIMNMLRKHFPRLLAGEISGKDVLLIMGDEKGRPRRGVHYIASEEFLTAIRVFDSGWKNFLTLVEGGGYQMTLLPPDAT